MNIVYFSFFCCFSLSEICDWMIKLLPAVRRNVIRVAVWVEVVVVREISRSHCNAFVGDCRLGCRTM